MYQQVQRVGLLIFKRLAQKEFSEGPNVESRRFLLFLAGEHFGDIFFHIINLIEVCFSKHGSTGELECGI